MQFLCTKRGYPKSSRSATWSPYHRTVTQIDKYILSKHTGSIFHHLSGTSLGISDFQTLTALIVFFMNLKLFHQNTTGMINLEIYQSNLTKSHSTYTIGNNQ